MRVDFLQASRLRPARVLGALLLTATLGLGAMPASAAAQPVQPLRVGDMPQIRASLKGRPMLMHVWSLTCAPCLLEMPLWAERIRQHPEVAFVFVNTDGLRHAAAAERRLAGYGVRPARSLIFADDFVERLQYDIAPDWVGELPRTEWNPPRQKTIVSLGPVSDALFQQWMAGARKGAPAAP